MSNLQKIESLVNDFFTGFTSWFDEKERIINLSTQKEGENLSVSFTYQMSVGEVLTFRSWEPIQGTNSPYYPIENSFSIHGNKFVDPSYSPHKVDIKFQLNKLKYKKANNTNLFLFLEESEFLLKHDSEPKEWFFLSRCLQILNQISKDGLCFYMT